MEKKSKQIRTTNWRIAKPIASAENVSNWRTQKQTTKKNTNSSQNYNGKISLKTQKQNTFKQESVEKSNHSHNTTNISQYYNKDNLNLSKTIQKTDSAITSEERKILYEEPLNTSNPLKAVLGYIPKDDQQICRFAVDGACFKKSRCLLSHDPPLAEGWTRDTDSVTVSICDEQIHPGVDTVFEIIPTCIEECGYKFYGQIVSTDLKRRFYDLMNEINTPEELIQFETYPQNLIPTLAELVLAKYSDGLFYRAKIIDYHENTDCVQVLFVDYGNTENIALQDIRKWNKKLEIVPFQALHFTLHGIKSKLKNNTELKEFLEEEILDKILIASTADLFDSTYIKLFENDGSDLADKLVELNFCERDDRPKFASKQNFYRIPG